VRSKVTGFARVRGRRWYLVELVHAGPREERNGRGGKGHQFIEQGKKRRFKTGRGTKHSPEKKEISRITSSVGHSFRRSKKEKKGKRMREENGARKIGDFMSRNHCQKLVPFGKIVKGGGEGTGKPRK